MKKSKLWPGTTPEERGKLAEESFFNAWEKTKLPPWIVSICRPTDYEDFRQKTDAVLVRINGPNLRFQIKSFPISADRKQELMSHGVIPIWILAKDSPRFIRHKMYVALEEFNRFHREISRSGIDKNFRGKRKKVRWRRR